VKETNQPQLTPQQIKDALKQGLEQAQRNKKTAHSNSNPDGISNFLHQLMNHLPEESRWILYTESDFLTQIALYQLILQFEQDVLRKVLQKDGPESDRYKFFLNIKNAIYQAGEAMYIIETLRKELSHFKEYNDFLMQRNAELEKTLLRWQTAEEMFASGMLESYMKRIREVAKREAKEK